MLVTVEVDGGAEGVGDEGTEAGGALFAATQDEQEVEEEEEQAEAEGCTGGLDTGSAQHCGDACVLLDMRIWLAWLSCEGNEHTMRVEAVRGTELPAGGELQQLAG